MEEPAEIEADQEKHKVNGATDSTRFRRLDSSRPHERDLREIEVELHAAADEECASDTVNDLRGHVEEGNS